MSSSRVGLQALIKDKAPLAIYTHCSGHCLNLVISHSSSLPTIQNVQSYLFIFLKQSQTKRIANRNCY